MPDAVLQKVAPPMPPPPPMPALRCEESRRGLVVNFMSFGDTAALTLAMAAGDGAAIESFYRQHFDRLYREARRCTRRDESFCLDVVQESVLRIVRAVRRVDSEPQLIAWLKLVVRTTAYDQLRAESRRRRREAAAHPASAVARDHHVASDQIAWLRRRIASLDPRLVELIELRYRERWPLGRIASKLGLSIGTIDGRLRRALKHLRDLAREELDDD
jgi:RNA polymerase sigma-70 factor, ECF subfamily